jgi:hypothetical protein
MPRSDGGWRKILEVESLSCANADAREFFLDFLFALPWIA